MWPEPSEWRRCIQSSRTDEVQEANCIHSAYQRPQAARKETENQTRIKYVDNPFVASFGWPCLGGETTFEWFSFLEALLTGTIFCISRYFLEDAQLQGARPHRVLSERLDVMALFRGQMLRQQGPSAVAAAFGNSSLPQRPAMSGTCRRSCKRRPST